MKPKTIIIGIMLLLFIFCYRQSKLDIYWIIEIVKDIKPDYLK